MVETSDDPREVPWHPRFADALVGHGEQIDRFRSALERGRPHHAWMLVGPKGIGKATVAYHLAKAVLGEKSRSWIEAGAHPDLLVLQRTLNDSKPPRLRTEITVDNARALSEFLARTSTSGGWRVVIIDACDELNSEAANSILKLVEEPPTKVLIFLICHHPGRILRTLRSRCQRLAFNRLTYAETLQVLDRLPLAEKPNGEELSQVARLSDGSPGQALELLLSEGAKAFAAFLRRSRSATNENLRIAQHFSTRAAASVDFLIFNDLLLGWIADQARQDPHSSRSQKLALAFQKLQERIRIVDGYNLDRRTCVLDALTIIDDALKAA